MKPIRRENIYFRYKCFVTQPTSLICFWINKVIITMPVILELDQAKQGDKEIHRNAREVIPSS